MSFDKRLFRAWLTQLRKGTVELAVLNMLAAGENYGYELAKRCGQIPGLEIKEATLYLLLNRLCEVGLLAHRVERTSGLRKRTYFSLSAKGKQHLDEMNSSYDLISTQLALLQQ